MNATILPIRNDLRVQIEAIIGSGISQAQICRESGVTSGQLSPWLKKKYQGDNAAVEDKLRNWIDARERKAALAHTLPEEPQWAENPTSRKIMSVLSYSQMAADIGIIYGGAGVGKTCTVGAYAEQNPNVWVVEMNASTCALASALDEIAHKLNVKATPGRPNHTLRDLIKRLRGTGGLLIIDEAQHLRTEALEGIRGIYDAAKIGLVICGNDSVYSRMTGGGVREANFAQLFSRIGKRLRLGRPAKDDIIPVINHFGIEEKDCVALCREIANKPGALRGLVKTLRLAGMFAAGEQTDAITGDHIRAAWRDLGGMS